MGKLNDVARLVESDIDTGITYATDPTTGERFALNGTAYEIWVGLESVKGSLAELTNKVVLLQDRLIGLAAQKATKKFGVKR